MANAGDETPGARARTEAAIELSSVAELNLPGGVALRDVRPAPEEDHAAEGTLALLYQEIGRDLDGQHGYVDQLNQRAQQLFGFANVILAILAAVVPTHPDLGTRIAYALALPVFALAALNSGRAWEFRKWRYDPDARQLWEHYRGKSEEHVRHQVIQNRLVC